MITEKDFQRSITLVVSPSIDDYLEINRLLAAAVVNQRFCRLLLADPELAIQNGYEDESFNFSASERSFILSLRANSLSDLAKQLLQTFDERPQLQYSYPAQVSELIGN